MTSPIVITGLGMASTIGCDESAFWASLCAGRSGASPVDCLNTGELSRKVACQIRFPMGLAESHGGADGVLGRVAPGRAAVNAMVAARQAGVDAGLFGGDAIREDAGSPQSIDIRQSTIDNPPNRSLAIPALWGARVAVIVGTTMGETDFIEGRLASPAEQWLDAEHARQIVAGRPGSIARNVQQDLGVAGYASDLYGACAAGNMAIAAACRMLQEDRCDVAIVGGSDGFSRLAFVGFMRARVMAAEVCRPFDEARDGLLVGEGSAMFVLEREADALARGARVRARVLGTSFVCESYHPTRPEPEGEGLTRSTLEAMRVAGVEPGDVDYVCAHGTGTPHNDAIEIKVMQKCFPKGVPFSSIKALTGHPMGGAAAIEAAACVLMLENQTLIPTWNLERPAPAEPLEPLMGRPRAGRVRCVLNNSAGFGGYNSSIILTA